MKFLSYTGWLLISLISVCLRRHVLLEQFCTSSVLIVVQAISFLNNRKFAGLDARNIKNMNILFIGSLLLLGLIGGFLAGLLGIGGGVIFVPIMVLLFTAQGMPLDLITHMAIATTMATVLFTALSSVRVHHQYQAVEWPLFWAISPGVLLGTLLGGKIFSLLHAGSLTLLFAGFVGFASWQMLSDRKKNISSSQHALPGNFTLASVGVGIGLISSLVGVGGGFIFVAFFSWCHLPIRRAVATSAALSIPVTAFATLNNIFYGYGLPGLPSGTLGYVYLPALVCVATASVLAAPFGVRLVHKIDANRLKRIFSILLFSLSIYMFIQALRVFQWL